MKTNIRQKNKTSFIFNAIVLLFLSYAPLHAACSDYTGDFFINEIHTWTDQVEIYAKKPATISGWSLKACTMEGNNNPVEVCEVRPFSYIPSVDGYFKIVDFNTIDFHDDAVDFLLYDDTGAIVNYFRVGRDLDTYPLQIVEASTCGLDVACNIFERTNSGQRNFQRVPDGSCTWEEDTGNNSGSLDDSNDGTVPAYVIIADYHMDQCFWSGNFGDVLDSTIFQYDGTSHISNTVDVGVAGGKTCRSGDFSLNVNTDYIDLPKEVLDGRNEFSFISWLKTDDYSTQEIISSINASSQAAFNIELSRFFLFFERIRVTINGVQKDYIFPFLSPNRITGQGWKQLSFILEQDEGCLYVDGTQIDCKNDAAWDDGINIKDNRLVLGQKIDNAGNLSSGFVGYMDEVGFIDKVLTQTELSSILTDQNAGINLDGTVRTCQVCDVFTPKDGDYTAVDSVIGACNAAVNWDDLLQTKIVNDDISLSILALEQGTIPPTPMEANITKVSLVHYPSGNNNACTGTALSSVDVCTNCGLTDVNGCLALSIDKSFNQRASRCVEILIQGKDKDDTTGISLSDSNSSDNLAIRPDTYNCDGVSSGVLISEHIYPSTFDATPLNLTTPTLGYTTSFVNITAKKYTRLGDLNSSLSGVFSPSTLNFVDGSASANLYFNDVGDVGIDINDSTWADVDSDDTAEVDRLIHTECRRLFIPDHFEVVLNKPRLENNSTFTYLSNDLTMSAWIRNLDVTITAQGEANGVMQNYTYPINTFYANQITLSPSLSLPSYGTILAVLGSNLSDENSTNITGFEFINGVATHSYEDMRFNYPRDFSSPVSPFRIDGNVTDFTLVAQDNLYPSVDGNDSTDADANATFYYGRLHPNDLVASIVPQTNTIPFEVYDATGSSFVSGMTQTGLSWYINSLHIDNIMGDIIEANASSSTVMGSLSGFSFTYLPVSVGEQDLNIATVGSEEKTVIHLKTQEWLWYVPFGFGSAYDDSAGSDCTMHPCFKLSINPVNTPSFIQSGTFEGAEVPDVNRSDYFKKGIKLFR